MESIFEKIFYVSSDFGRIQEFVEFTKKVHDMAQCSEDDCDVKSFSTKLDDDIFNEELSYDCRRIKFTEVCLSSISIFNAMFQLHPKHNDNIEKIQDLVESPVSIINRQLEQSKQLTELNLEKYTIQKKIEALGESFF